MNKWFDIITYDIVHYLFIGYSATLIITYLILVVLSLIELKKYLRRNSIFDYTQFLASSFCPKITVIAPAFNEGNTIVDNLRSLLSLNYPEFEIILVNDGSTDDSIEKLIEAYQLKPVKFEYYENIPTATIKNVYKSTNAAYSKVIVIDKINGGKADALNAGINLSTAELVACIDVDCVLNQDALVKLVKPFLENNKEQIIASGSVIRVINNCTVEGGKITKVRLPKNLWAKFQTLEYLRTFLLARMAWSKLNGLLLISGAVGLFRKELVIKVGGYSVDTVGEDMELVVKMRRYLEERKEKYKVVYIPDPLCWTEVPESLKILGSQRNRWTRGLVETVTKHKRIFFNPKFRILGLISFPFWVFYEWLAPLIEFSGLIYFRFLAVHHMVNWFYFFALLLILYLFSVLFSVLAIIAEETTYKQYSNKRDLFKLFLVSLIEPILYHPFLTLSSVKGNLLLLFTKKKNRKWGTMTRVGFDKKK